MIVMTKSQAAYIAGIVDGEGYLQPGTQGTNSFGIRVAMCDRGAVDFCLAAAGGWSTSRGKTKAGRPVYVWAVQKKADLRRVLKAIRPHLRVKGAEADKMVELLDHLDAMPRWDSRPSSSLSPAQREREGRREKRATWVARREELREELKQIKHVGVG